MWSLSLIRQSTKCDGYKSCEVEIWSILIFNVRRRIHMIVLLQSAAIQFGRLFKHISYYTKRGKVILLQSVRDCYYKVHQVLQSVTDCYYKCVKYYKVWHLLQSDWDIKFALQFSRVSYIKFCCVSNLLAIILLLFFKQNW